MRAANCRSAVGFTLIEIAVVLTIIGILIAAVLRGTGMIGSANIKDIITVSQDLSTAIREFKQRYHMYPGDFPVNATTPEIPGMSVRCMVGGANGGNGNGVIEPLESSCVPEALVASGLAGKSSVGAGGVYSFTTSAGPVTIMATSVVGIGIPNTVNVMTLTNVPCTIALEIDRAMDDGVLTSGKVQGSATCTAGGAGDPVPTLAIGL